jgi:hypothetical protein
VKPSILLFIFVFGVAVGLTGAILGPRYLGSYLPTFITGETHRMEGTVVRMQRDPARLLVTVSTSEGAMLATFTQKVSEIGLLLAEGDEVTVALRRYEPFVTNPPIVKVVKGSDVSNHGQTESLTPTDEARDR